MRTRENGEGEYAARTCEQRELGRTQGTGIRSAQSGGGEG